MAEQNRELQRQHAMEAMKLLGSYGKWVVAMEVGTIAGVKALGLLEAGVTTFILAAAAVIACGFAVWKGVLLMLALPSIAQRLHQKPGTDIFDKSDPDLGDTPLRNYTLWNFRFFVVGIALFAVAILSTFHFTWNSKETTLGKALDTGVPEFVKKHVIPSKTT